MDKYLPIKHFMDENGIGYREDVTGSECTTFKLGGAVPLFAEPANQEQAEKLLSFVTENDIAFFVIGNGSNLLITDAGCDCLFIKLSGELVEYRIENGMLICGAGASLAAASRASVLAGYMGLEWATGIPGTIGGAVAMNAGAYGGEIKQVLKSVKVFCNDGVRRQWAIANRRMPTPIWWCLRLCSSFGRMMAEQGREWRTSPQEDATSSRSTIPRQAAFSSVLRAILPERLSSRQG